MIEKFNIYDIIGVLIPGVLVIATMPLAFPSVAAEVTTQKFPSSFVVIILTALAVFTGHLVQAIASLMEPVLYWTWGGRASERALDHGLGERYFPAGTGARIRAKLAEIAHPNASTRSLFILAMQRAESSDSPRVSAFNGLYAYHRALVVLTAITIILFVVSFHGGVASQLSWKQDMAIATLKERLPETLRLADERERKVYEETDEAKIKEATKLYSDFVAFCEEVEQKTGRPPDISGWW